MYDYEDTEKTKCPRCGHGADNHLPTMGGCHTRYKATEKMCECELTESEVLRFIIENFHKEFLCGACGASVEPIPYGDTYLCDNCKPKSAKDFGLYCRFCKHSDCENHASNTISCYHPNGPPESWLIHLDGQFGCTLWEQKYE